MCGRGFLVDDGHCSALTSTSSWTSPVWARAGYMEATWSAAASSWVAERRAWSWRVRLSGLPSFTEASSAAAWRLSWGHLHVSVYGCFQKNFVFLKLSLAWFALGNLVHYSLYASYRAVTLPESGCCLWSAGWIFREILVCYSGANTWFDSGYMFCISCGATAKWVRILKSFLSVLTQNGDVCSVDASVFHPLLHSSHLEPGQFFLSFMWLRRVMMECIFAVFSSIFRTLSVRG